MAERTGMLKTMTLTAAADLSAHQYTIMRLIATRQCNVASNAAGPSLADAPVGVLQNKPNAAGRAATVAVAGSNTKVVAGGALVANKLVTCNGSGRAAHPSSGDWVVGRLYEAAAADGDIIEMQIVSPYKTDVTSGY